MPTAAAYIRVSDERQDEFSPDSQLALIRKFCEEKHLSLPEEYIFFDDGISAKSSARRIAFLEMITLAKSSSHPIDAIVVWKYSRFARNQEESIVYKSMLKRHHVEVLSVSEPISSDPFGSLVERIIEWMDEYYLIRLSGEVRRGMTEKALRGLPNAPPPIGYTLKNGRLVPHPQEAETVKLVFSLYLGGLSPALVAKELERRGIRTRRGVAFDPRGIRYILQNPIYAGFTRWSKEGRMASDRHFDSDRFILAKGEHAPLISRSDFEASSTLLSTIDKIERHQSKKHYMLHGLLRCGICGGAMLLCNGRSPFFRCVNRTRQRCSCPTVSSARLSASVIHALEVLFPTLILSASNYANIFSTPTTLIPDDSSTFASPITHFASIDTPLSKREVQEEAASLFPPSPSKNMRRDFLGTPPTHGNIRTIAPRIYSNNPPLSSIFPPRSRDYAHHSPHTLSFTHSSPGMTLAKFLSTQQIPEEEKNTVLAVLIDQITYYPERGTLSFQLNRHFLHTHPLLPE